MRGIIWITEGTWQACVDTARTVLPADADITLLHVTAGELPAAAHGAYAGLLGRAGRADHDPGAQIEELAAASAAELLAAAAQRLGRPADRVERRGRTEHEVIAAAETADLLILARDGDRTRLGPHSLGPASRFVLDHAPCAVLLVWPEPTPSLTTLPPHPPRHPRPR